MTDNDEQRAAPRHPVLERKIALDIGYTEYIERHARVVARRVDKQLLTSARGGQTAAPGEWLVVLETGTLLILTNEEFTSLFERVD